MMKQVIQLISLRTIKHSDRHWILRAYSRELGSVAFAIGAGNTAEANRRRALLMPLGIVECVAVRRQGSDLLMMSDARSIFQSMDMRLDPAKNAIGLFMAEMLSVVLRDGPPDAALFDFVQQSVMVLDAIPGRRVANFHLAFLVGLAGLLGISPDYTDYRPGMIFDLFDGRFRTSAPIHGRFLGPDYSAAAARLGRMTYRNMHIYKYTRAMRNEVLDAILRYYELHYTGLRELKSPEVLRQC